jgi:DNA-binding transcriptional MerR regulator
VTERAARSSDRAARAGSGGAAREGAAVRAFRSREVAEILGLSRRQLQYWAQTDLVRPSVATRGGHHRYTFQDLVALRAAKRLLDAGISVQRIRSSIQALRRILPTVRHPLAELVLVATGDVVLVFRDGAAFEAASGQEWVLEVAQLEREIEAWRTHGATGSPRRAFSTTASDTD